MLVNVFRLALRHRMDLDPVVSAAPAVMRR